MVDSLLSIRGLNSLDWFSMRNFFELLALSFSSSSEMVQFPPSCEMADYSVIVVLS